MAFIITSLAGFSTLIGSIIIFFKVKNKSNIINISLSFAAGIMISVSLTDLIPESYNLFDYPLFIKIIYILISINIGIIISMTIDKLLPESNSLYRVGVISMLAIILHNIPEGIATYTATIHNKDLGLCLGLAIALHNIPEGISISLPIYYSTNNKMKALIYTFISGASEILGAFLSCFFLKDLINNSIMGILLGIISGLMIHISCYELIPEALKMHKYKISLLSFITGVIVMFISHLLIT